MISQTRQQIMEAVEKARADGWTIEPGQTWNYKMRCCPLGAVCVTQDLEMGVGAASEFLGISIREGLSFAIGFDLGAQMVQDSTEYFSLGGEIRETIYN